MIKAVAIGGHNYGDFSGRGWETVSSSSSHKDAIFHWRREMEDETLQFNMTIS
jgi:hypothetical protein